MRLNVQPLSAEELMALPEGDRSVKRLKSFGPAHMSSVNEPEGIPADRLFYHGEWYECKSSDNWDHTMLAHFRSEFVLLPPAEQEAAPS